MKRAGAAEAASTPSNTITKYFKQDTSKVALPPCFSQHHQDRDPAPPTPAAAARVPPLPFARPVFLFAHGAGAPSASDWMQAWRRRLEHIGDVVTFDYDYMNGGKGGPGNMPSLVACHTANLEAAQQKFPVRICRTP